MVFHKNPCGIFCILLTYGLVGYADFVIIQHVVSISLSSSLWGPLHTIAFNIVVLALLFAHGRAVLSDPGTVPLPSVGLDFSDIRMKKKASKSQLGTSEDWTICQRCDTYRPPRAHHCKVCRRCIRRMDHHCPCPFLFTENSTDFMAIFSSPRGEMVNNCIGEFNQKYFIQFLFYTGLLCTYALGLNIANWVWMFGEGKNTNADILSRKSTVVHSIALAIESLLFGAFVIAMLHDQMKGIFGDETAVEFTIRGRKMKPSKPRRPKMALLREVFGYGPVYSWFFPCLSRSITIRSMPSGSYNV